MEAAESQRPVAAPASRGGGWWRWAWTARPIDRVDALVATVLALGSLAVLVQARARYLNTTDSFLFALGTQDYDFSRAHPHPPGYPIFVFLARIALVFVGEENAALVWISVLFALASVVALYVFAREFTSIGAASVATILFAVSPNLLYNGALALSYTAEGAMSIIVAWAALRARDGRFPFWAIGILFGLALGLRQSSVFFLTPIVAWSLFHRWPDRRRFAAGAAGLVGAGVATCLAWFVPMIAFGGGLDVWLATTRLQSRSVVFVYTVFTHGWPAVMNNVRRLRLFTEADVALLWAAIPMTLLVLATRKRTRTVWPEYGLRRRDATAVLLFWALPSVLFYTFIFSGSHQGPRGYILVLEPAMFAVVAILLQKVVSRLFAGSSRRGASVAVAAVAVLVLLLGIPLGVASQALLKKEVRDHDTWSREWLRVKDEYSPDDTAIMATHSWGFTKWYFPEYVVWNFMPVTPDPAGTPLHFIMESRHHEDDVALYDSWLHQAWRSDHAIPPEIHTIILLDFQLAGENDAVRAFRSEIAVEEAHLSTGWRILIVHPDAEHPTVESMMHLDDRTPQPR
jgi:hypothetical protein